MTPQGTARAAVAHLVLKNPRQSAADIAKAAGVSRQRAHKLLADLGYELVFYWRRKRKVSVS